jgi:hypothetical protein
MAFHAKEISQRLRHQVNTSLNDAQHEVWIHLCRKHEKSSHQLLREVIEKFCKEEMNTKLPVIEALRGHRGYY